jgi:DNA polymerase I-like protein with 3'-5' exonuclease and polymerase domains
MNERLIAIKTLKQLKELEEYVKDKDYIAFDCETTGTDKESQVIGFSICADIEVGYYVILSYWDSSQKRLVDLETKKEAKKFILGLIPKLLIMQNAPFDCARTKENFGVELMSSVVHDTLVGGHLLNENRLNGLKERAVELYGEDERKEQAAMKASVEKNGGVLNKKLYELYKADADLLAHYGAKDAIMTLKLFYNDVPFLFEEKLDKFFYDDETMPLLRGPTYDMNTTGLRVDPEKLQKLKETLQAECLDAKGFIYKEITPLVKVKYPGTSKAKTFNIGSSQQLAWLLFIRMNRPFNTLTKGGRELCRAMEWKIPYSLAGKREFIQAVSDNKGHIYAEAAWNPKKKKMGRPKKIGDPWKYLSFGKATMALNAPKYKWVEKLQQYAKNMKLLNTYVLGIQGLMKYNVIHPNFLQHGTTSGRYSCKHPNFQNLPRDDKRVKACIIARPGNVFVGADYAQLEPRVFASTSKDETLCGCFDRGEDFYSVVGAPIYDKTDCSMFKSDANSFAKKYPKLRDDSKIIALATPYGRTAFQQAQQMGISTDEAQELIDKYFEAYPKVELMMLESHELAKKNGVVYNLFGRPRRMPEAMDIPKIYGNASHGELPYAARNLLNLAMNHRVQSTAASIMNRAAIAVWKKIQHLWALNDAGWDKVKIVLQVHDELILEGPEHLKDQMIKILKDCMENTTKLPGVALIAEPKAAYNLADLK